MGSAFNETTHDVTLIGGISYTFTCEIFGADEEADVTWSLTPNLTTPANEINQAQSTDVDCVLGQDNVTFDLVADVKVHNGMILTCGAANSAGAVHDQVTLNAVHVGKIKAPLHTKGPTSKYNNRII